MSSKVDTIPLENLNQILAFCGCLLHYRRLGDISSNGFENIQRQRRDKMKEMLGRMLFPRDAEWERKRKLDTALLVVFVAAILGLIVAALIVYSGHRMPH